MIYMSEDIETWKMSLYRYYKLYIFRGKTKSNVWLLLKLVFVISVTYIILNTLRIHKSIKLTNPLKIRYKNFHSLLRKLSEKLRDKESLRSCPIPRLKNHRIPKIKVPFGRNKTKEPYCHRVAPLAESCDVTKLLFLDQPKGTCSHQEPIQICTFKGTSNDLECDPRNCKGLQLGYRETKTGKLVWSQAQSTDELMSNINLLLKTQDHSGFCYIKCENEEMQSRYSEDSMFQDTDGFDNVQLLILPPNVKNNPNVRLPAPSINVNLIFIDSVSRHHFFRSLPGTIKFFEEVNSLDEAVVFDFELLQAIRSRTFETLDSLFAGIIPQTDNTFGRFEMPPEPLKIEGLFGLFKDAGYETLWMEDLCFEWEWGISKDLLVHNKSLTTEETWRRLMKAFDRLGIGSFGITSANCDILSHNGVNDHFHGPDTVCFNGRHQHDYMLEYLQLYQKKMSSSGRAYLTFFETNVGHEDKGSRIQTLDAELENYLRFAVEEENTLTVVFSDHGNAYGKYVDQSQEARVEMFQPAMFFVVPRTVSGRLGTDKMEALTMNQNRLVSHLDVHYTIRSLVSGSLHIPQVNRQYLVTHEGLFANVSLERRCLQAPQILPNVCICEGGESRVVNNSATVLYAHFAVGSLNNDIQSQFRGRSRQIMTGFGRCVRLELASFQNVRSAINLDHSRSLTMDLMFESGDPDFHRYEVFVVTVQSEPDGRDMQLVKHDRLTPYSKYSTCVDKGVKLQLCICAINYYKFPIWNILTTSNILMKANMKYIKHSQDCLYLIQQENREGMTVSLANVCSTWLIHVELEVGMVNLVLSADPRFQLYLKPGETRFLYVGIRTHNEWDSSLEIKFTLTEWA